MKRLLLILGILLGLAATGGGVVQLVSGSSGKSQASDPSASSGDDATNGGGSGSDGDGTDGNGSSGSSAKVAKKSPEECGIPPSPSLPPGFVAPEDSFAKPKNDFPFTLTISPKKGFRKSRINADVVVGTPRAFVVMTVTFNDNKNHGTLQARGVRGGKATFTIVVPEEAPLGYAKVVASASNPDVEGASALATQRYIVSAPGCP